MSDIGDRFDPCRAAADLTRETQLDLVERTAAAHQDLSETWHSAVTDRFGSSAANVLADQGWPQRRTGATPQQLFLDDLRFTTFVAGLNPTMLTVAEFDVEALPPTLRYGAPWYRSLLRARRVAPTSGPRVSPDAPGQFLLPVENVKKRAINAGYPALLGLWRRLDARPSSGPDPETLDDVGLEALDARGLALVWNLTAIAYMMATDRWYTAVRERYDAETARSVEYEVWVDRGMAERDLEIGLEAQHIEDGDITGLLKGFQFAPGEVGILDVDFTLDGPDRGVLTHKTCPAITRMEHHDPERLEHCCEICVVAMPLSGQLVSDDIECRPLKIPPRHGPRDIACQWEYRHTPKESGQPARDDAAASADR